MEHLPYWVPLTCCGVLGVAWVIVTAIKQRCKHVWECVGEVKNINRTNDRGQDICAYKVQPVHRTVCGRLHYFPITPTKQDPRADRIW